MPSFSFTHLVVFQGVCPLKDQLNSSTRLWLRFLGPLHSAVIYTFVEQVRRHGQDPFAYFKWVFEQLMHDSQPADLERLLPSSWMADIAPAEQKPA